MRYWLAKSLVLLMLALRVLAQDTAEEEKPKKDSDVAVTEDESETSRAKDESETKSKKHKGFSHTSSTHSGRDVVLFGENLVLNEGEIVHDVTIIGGSASIDGKVTGELVVIGGLVTLGPKAEVSHDVVIVGGGLDADRNAKIKGERNVFNFGTQAMSIPGFEGASDWVGNGLLKGRLLVPHARWNWLAAGVFILLYLVLALLFPTPLEATIGVLETRPGSSFLTGLITFVLFAPLLLLLVVTVIGLVLVPFVVCALIAAFLFGKTAVYGYAGRRIGGGARALHHPVVAVIIGAILFCLLYMVPIVGFLVWAIVATLGVGAVLLAFFRKVRSESPTPLPPIASGPPGPVSPALGVAPSAQAIAGSPALQQRAGFWLRLVATLIDAALMITLCVMLSGFFRHGHSPKGVLLFFVLWTAYHLAMWVWRGATIGGIVLGLQLVQSDGRPVTLPVAIVRFLAGFLSAAVLLIGFFWAGWSSQKQSWHDKIAGTYVLKGIRNKTAPPVSQPA